MFNSKKHKPVETSPPVISLWRAILWLVVSVYAFFFVSRLVEAWINPVLSSRGISNNVIAAATIALIVTFLSLVAGSIYGWVGPYVILDAIFSLREEVKPHLDAGSSCDSKGYDVDVWYYIYIPGTTAVFIFAIFLLVRRRLPI